MQVLLNSMTYYILQSVTKIYHVYIYEGIFIFHLIFTLQPHWYERYCCLFEYSLSTSQMEDWLILTFSELQFCSYYFSVWQKCCLAKGKIMIRPHSKPFNSLRTGIHFMNNFCIRIQIQQKFPFSLIQIVVEGLL